MRGRIFKSRSFTGRVSFLEALQASLTCLIVPDTLPLYNLALPAPCMFFDPGQRLNSGGVVMLAGNLKNKQL
jgi:hypothetical protein